MFWGTHRVRVDEKGRLAIPAQFRRQLPEGSFISIGQDGVLTIYPPDQWESLASRLQDPLQSQEQRALSRALFSKAVACEFDAQGRVGLSAAPRRLAGNGRRASSTSTACCSTWASPALSWTTRAAASASVTTGRSTCGWTGAARSPPSGWSTS